MINLTLKRQSMYLSEVWISRLPKTKAGGPPACRLPHAAQLGTTSPASWKFLEGAQTPSIEWECAKDRRVHVCGNLVRVTDAEGSPRHGCASGMSSLDSEARSTLLTVYIRCTAWWCVQQHGDNQQAGLRRLKIAGSGPTGPWNSGHRMDEGQ